MRAARVPVESGSCLARANPAAQVPERQYLPRRVPQLAVVYLEASIESLKGVLPEDLKVDWTSNEPRRVERKIELFDQNLIEAIGIVIIVALVFMEWRSARRCFESLLIVRQGVQG